MFVEAGYTYRAFSAKENDEKYLEKVASTVRVTLTEAIFKQ